MEVFWRLNSRWLSYFSAEKFAHRPLHIIQGALGYLGKIESMEAANNSDAIAVLTAAYFQAHGSKDTDIGQLNPHRHRWQVTEAKEEIPEETARITLELMKEGKLPHWTINVFEPVQRTLELAAL